MRDGGKAFQGFCVGQGGGGNDHIRKRISFVESKKKVPLLDDKGTLSRLVNRGLICRHGYLFHSGNTVWSFLANLCGTK